MARGDKIPRDPNLPRPRGDQLEGWSKALVDRLSSVLARNADSVNLLIDGFLLGVNQAPPANAENRSRMVVVQGGTGTRDRLYWVRREADGSYYLAEVAEGPIRRTLTAAVTVDPPSLGAGAIAEFNVTVSGAEPGDVAIAGFSSVGTNPFQITANVSASNTVRVLFRNAGSTTIDLPSGTLRVWVFKH